MDAFKMRQVQYPIHAFEHIVYLSMSNFLYIVISFATHGRQAQR